MSVSNQRLSKQITFKTKICLNHQDRKASHQLLSFTQASDFFYCHKCSIKLASQGHTLFRINPTPRRTVTSLPTQQKPRRLNPSALRRADIGRFLIEIKNTKENLEKNSLKLQEYLIRSQSQFGLIIQAINQFFGSIQQIVETQKYIALNNVLNKRSAHQSHARFMKANIRQQIQDVSTIISDIEDNMDGVQEVENSVYNQIMNGYLAKLSCMEDNQREIKKIQPIGKFNIRFPEFPKNLDSLGNQIIVNIHKVQPLLSDLHMNSQVQGVTSEDQNQPSFLSEIFCKKQKPQPQNKGKMQNYSENSFGNMSNTQQLAFSLTHFRRGASSKQLDQENEMFHSNCLEDSWMAKNERESQQQSETFLKQKSLISEAETLLIS